LINNKSEVLCKTASVTQLDVASWHLLGGLKESYTISRSGFEPWTFRFKKHECCIQGSVHHEIYANNCPTRCNYIQFIYICKPLYMFRVISPPIIRSSCQCRSVHSGIYVNNCPTRCNCIQFEEWKTNL